MRRTRSPLRRGSTLATRLSFEFAAPPRTLVGPPGSGLPIRPDTPRTEPEPELPHVVAMTCAQPSGVDAVPDFEFEQTAGDERAFLPERRLRKSILGQQLGEDDRAVDVDHGSARYHRRPAAVRRGAQRGRGGRPSRRAGALSVCPRSCERFDERSNSTYSNSTYH